MATVKEQVIEFVEGLPEDLSLEALEKKLIEEVRYRRHVREMVEESRRDITAGRTYSHAEIAKKLGFDP